MKSQVALFISGVLVTLRIVFALYAVRSPTYVVQSAGVTPTVVSYLPAILRQSLLTPTSTTTPTPTSTPSATSTPTPTATTTLTPTPTATSAVPLFETVLLVANENGYADAPDHATLDLGTGDGEDFTVETFFYVSDLNYDPTVIDLLARKDGSYSLYISFNNGQPDWLSFRLWTAAGDMITLSYLTDLGLGWHHVAAVFDNEFTGSEDLLAIYLDGTRVANSADENIHVDWTPGLPNSTSVLLIGGVPFGTAGFTGLIEEIRFSDIVRYSGISYSVPALPFTSDSHTRALWHFDEAAGSTIFADSSNNSNVLTGHNGAQSHNP